MKTIVFFHESSNLWDANSRHCYENHRAVAEEHKILFEKCGYPVVICNPDDVCDLRKVLDLLKHDSVCFAMGTNAAGLDFYTDDGMGWFEKYSVPYVSLFADHPYLNHGMFMNRLRNARCRQLFISVVNGAVDEKCLELAGLHYDQCFYTSPHLELDDFELDADRDIGVLFTGRIYPTGIPTRRWNQNNLPDRIKICLNKVADYLETYAVSVVDAFCFVLRSCDMEEQLPTYYSYFGTMLTYIMQWRRLKLVETLVDYGVPVVMCDASWRNYKYAHKMKILNTQYQETLQLYRRAQIVVADLAGFNNYTHDRVLHAVKYGAAVVCEQSTWMDTYFYSKSAMKGFHWQQVDDVPHIIERLLHHESERVRMAKKAFAILRNQFSCEKYVKKILSVVSKACPVDAGGEL